jgi:hypothetical protein
VLGLKMLCGLGRSRIAQYVLNVRLFEYRKMDRYLSDYSAAMNISDACNVSLTSERKTLKIALALQPCFAEFKKASNSSFAKVRQAALKPSPEPERLEVFQRS